jgi:hypothetical protein
VSRGILLNAVSKAIRVQNVLLIFHPIRHASFCLVPFHLMRYSPFWVLASLRKHLLSSVSSDCILHPHSPRTRDLSLQATSSHLVLHFFAMFMTNLIPL